MSRGLNKAQIIGNVGRDPEIRSTPSGVLIANLSVGVTEKRKDGDHTEWFRVVAFNKLAEIIQQYIKKGSAVYMEGRMQTKKYEDKNGVEKYSTELVADQMLMLGGKSGAPRQKAMAPKQEAAFDDDIPF